MCMRFSSANESNENTLQIVLKTMMMMMMMIIIGRFLDAS